MSSTLSNELARARARATLFMGRREEALEALSSEEAPWAAEMRLRLAVREGAETLQAALEQSGPALSDELRALYRGLATGEAHGEALEAARKLAGDDPYGHFAAGLILAGAGREAEAREALEAFLADPSDPWVAAALPPAEDCEIARTLLGGAPRVCRLCRQPAEEPVCPACTAILQDPEALAEVAGRSGEDPEAAAWLERLEDLSASLGTRQEEAAPGSDVGWEDPNDYRGLDSDELLALLGEDGCAVVADAQDPLTLGALVSAIRRHPEAARGVDPIFLDALGDEAMNDQAADQESSTPAAYWALHLAAWFAGLDPYAQGRVRLRHLAAGVAWAAIAENPQARALWPWLATEAHALVVYYPSQKQREQLAALLADNPDEPFLRLLQLLWSRRDVEAGGPRWPYAEAVLWVLAHHPWLMLPVLTLLRPEDDPEGYLDAVQGWREALAEEEPLLLERAASFFTLPEPRVSEAAYLRLQELQPNDAEWCRWLSHLYALHRHGTPSARGRRVERALEEAEKAARMAPDSELRYYLGQAVDLALESGDLERAERWGAALLESVGSGPDGQSDWNYGNVLHKANLALGRVALRKGDLEEARRRLLEAGRTPGSPQLDSFGPNMRLAAEFLEAGESEVVLEYLDLCKQFWSMGADRLAAWRLAIQQGRPVHFGANLNY